MQNLPATIEQPKVTVRSAYDSLSQRKRAFVDHVVLTGDTKLAYLAVFPHVDHATARYHGLSWSRDPLIGAAIFERTSEAGAQTRITLENTINEIGKLAFSNIRKFLQVDGSGQIWFEFKEGVDGLTLDDWAAVSDIQIEYGKKLDASGKPIVEKVKIKLHSKLDALDKLMKRWGAYAAQQMNHTGTVRHEGVIATVEMTPEKLAEMYAARLQESDE